MVVCLHSDIEKNKPKTAPGACRGRGLSLVCAGLVGTKLCAGSVWSISTFQPCTSAQTNPNPKPNSNPLGGSRSAGAATRPLCVFWRIFPKKLRADEKASLDQEDQHAAQSFVPTSPACSASHDLKGTPAIFLRHAACNG